jgi:hypothetical protein
VAEGSAGSTAGGAAEAAADEVGRRFGVAHYSQLRKLEAFLAARPGSNPTAASGKQLLSMIGNLV